MTVAFDVKTPVWWSNGVYDYFGVITKLWALKLPPGQPPQDWATVLSITGMEYSVEVSRLNKWNRPTKVGERHLGVWPGWLMHYGSFE